MVWSNSTSTPPRWRSRSQSRSCLSHKSLAGWANWAKFLTLCLGFHVWQNILFCLIFCQPRWWTQECWPSSPSFSVLGWSGAQSRPSTSSTPTRSWAPPYLSWASWAWPTLSLPLSCSNWIHKSSSTCCMTWTWHVSFLSLYIFFADFVWFPFQLALCAYRNSSTWDGQLCRFWIHLSSGWLLSSSH